MGGKTVTIPLQSPIFQIQNKYGLRTYTKQNYETSIRTSTQIEI